MASIIGRQKMTVRHAEGEHTIFPSAEPQFLPDHLLDHPHVEAGKVSGWITVVPDHSPESTTTIADEPAGPEKTDSASAPRRRRSA